MTPVEVPDLQVQPPAMAAAFRPGILRFRLSAPEAGRERRALLGAVFGVSLSVLAFEIALTRLFAAVLAYHFVFAAVSMGLLGLGVGGILLAWLPRQADGRAVLRQLGMFALGEAGSLVLALAFFLRYPEGDRLLPFALAALPPFLFAGLFLSLALRRYAAMGSRVYFADMTGAAAGTLVAVLLLQAFGPPATVLLLAGVVTLAAAICLRSAGSRQTAALAAALGLLVVGVAAGKPQAPWLTMELAGKRSTSKHLLSLLAEADIRVRLVATTWDAYARTDVVDLGEGDDAKRVIFTDGGAAAVMPRFRQTGADLEGVIADIGVLPFLQGSKDRVLVIGPGGGQDVLLALLAGAREITAVEVNPAAVRAVDRFADYNGGLYRYRNVKVVVGEGRNYVRRSHERYDLIYLPLVMTKAAEAVGYSLVENYVFTLEAFRDYLAHLLPGGRLVIKAHDTMDLTRAFLTALAVQQRQGQSPKEAVRRLLVFQENPLLPGDPGGVMYPLLIFREAPYSPREAEEAFTQAVAAGMFPLFVPGVHDALGFGALVQDEQSLQAFTAAFPARITPTTDDSPFFYEFSRPLPSLLRWLLAGVVALLLLVTGVAGKVEGRRLRARTRWGSVAYFGALGGAFMLVEIPVLQRSIFALGFPTLAFSVVLFALLLGAGIGSYLSAWVDDAGLERAVTRASLLAGLLAATWLAIGPGLLEQWAGGGLLSRSLVAMGLLLPLGAAMGAPFPLGIRLLRRAGRTAAVPWMWAVNGVVSVAASVGAVAVAIVAGFSWAMALGAILYAAAAGLARLGFWGLVPSTGPEMPA
ncbi:MAG: class I SAM-dependent methyltransferase [candidate division NC10 bacterium]|nr:class I SAM-dependent methyltransferase [candidate division NC10 bacterium]